MTAPVVELRLAQAHEITDTSVLRIGRVDYPVLSLYVTRSECRVLQLAGEQAPRVFCRDDIVTLVVPADSGGVAGDA